MVPVSSENSRGPNSDHGKKVADDQVELELSDTFAFNLECTFQVL